MSDLDRLEKLAREATPGPWEWEPPSKDAWPLGDESLVTSWNEADGYQKSVVSGWGHDASGTSASDEDRAYIAAANPSVVLDLIARVRTAEAERDAYKARLDAVASLASQWDGTPDYQPTDYDRGRVDQRHEMTMQLLESLDGDPTG